VIIQVIEMAIKPKMTMWT